MAFSHDAPWHAASFEQFIREGLPGLLAARLPLAGYGVEPTGRYACRVRVAIAAGRETVEVEYADIPRPDDEGIFEIDGQRRVVVPMAEHADLATATVRCVGEQLFDDVSARLGDAPAGLPWDEALARVWLPLDRWIGDFFRRPFWTSHRLDQSNWLARHAHLRRIYLEDNRPLVTPGLDGRVCPFEMPEGPNLGRIYALAAGAAIRDGRVVIADDRPEAGLGVAALMIPCLEHSEPARLLMGANMLRQWLIPAEPEPALAQTGHEPAAPDFWCGRDLLTAFIAGGADAHEDGIVISESCARRLSYPPQPVEPGDKLSNRHGAKGVVSRILPDAQMPHLPDGTPVELVYSFIGIHTRMNVGQVREAIISRIARAEGAPAIVPPYAAPSDTELRTRLAGAGLPESGMERLTLGRDGLPLPRPSVVGWVYWGRLWHVASDKLQVSVDGRPRRRPSVNHAAIHREPGMLETIRAPRQGEADYAMLRAVGAHETIREQFNTRAAERPEVATLAERLAAGPVEQAGPPSPGAETLARRLAIAGIVMELAEDQLAFRFAPPAGERLTLAEPVAHPWLPDRSLTEIGALAEPTGRLAPAEAKASVDRVLLQASHTPASVVESAWTDLERAEYAALAEANARLARLLASDAPTSLTEPARGELAARLRAFCDALLRPEHLRFGATVAFGGVAVLTPGPELRLDQIGVADEFAWTLFGPLAAREVGAAAVEARDAAATRALDAVMARTWVILCGFWPTAPHAVLAFHPVRDPGRVIRLHPLLCGLLNADFDGDQATIYLPVTAAGQREAEERLTVAAYLARDPSLLRALLPRDEAMWGLADLSRDTAGREEIARLAGAPVAAPAGFITREALHEAVRAVLDRDGVSAVLAALQRLMERGFGHARESGASISPFVGASLDRPTPPQDDDADAWSRYVESLAERLTARDDLDDADLGPQLLAMKSGARGRPYHLLRLTGPESHATNSRSETVAIRHGWREGLTPPEMLARASESKAALSLIAQEWEQARSSGTSTGPAPTAFTVLARARRANHPGMVFAHAAATGEVDPLTDVDSRLFIGLTAHGPNSSDA
jgi:hypothetical protein